MIRRSPLNLLRRKHFVATPYDFIQSSVAPAISTDKIFTTISEEAQVPNNWRSLSDEEVQRLLRIMPAFVDSCKERHIQLRREATYLDLRRAAGHRARVRLHSRLDRLGDDGLIKWGRAHMYPAEP